MKGVKSNMATKTRKSGFDAPTIGTVMPKGTTFRRRPDGTMEAIIPKKKGKKK